MIITVELYEGSGSNWRLVKTGSPVNIGSFEDVSFANNEMQDTPVVVSLFPNFQEGRCVVGMAYVDLTRRILGLAEFLDDSRFTNLESSSLIALGAKRMHFPSLNLANPMNAKACMILSGEVWCDDDNREEETRVRRKRLRFRSKEIGEGEY